MSEHGRGENGSRLESRGQQIRDTRPEAARQDYERRKKEMLKLAEERGCLQSLRLMLKLADVQSGFSDEQALFDYNRRESERTRKGERMETHDVFRSYATHGSDWLRSLEALSAAMTPTEGVPGLLEVASLETDEGRKFEAWCQTKYLNAQTLMNIMNHLRADRNIDLAALQKIPYRELGRIILETHLDRLMVENDCDDSPKRGYLPLPVDGFSEPPTQVIQLASRSAGKDALNAYLAVATYIDEKEERVPKPAKSPPDQEPPPPRIVRYAHGVHVAPVDDLRDLCPQLFTEYKPDPYDPRIAQPHTNRDTGVLVRTMMVQIRGWKIGGIHDNRYQDVGAHVGSVLDVLVDDAIMGEKMRFAFHQRNKALISSEQAEKLYQRSAGRVGQNTVTTFDLREWYVGKISKLGNITSAKQLEAFKNLLTLTLKDVIGQDLAKSLTEHYPERINFGDNRVAVEYTYEPDSKKHGAQITLNADRPERAEALVTLFPKAMPHLGENGQPPVNVSFIVRPQQVDEQELSKSENLRFGIRNQDNPYPSKTFADLGSALDYLEEARIDYAMQHIDSRTCVFTSPDGPELASLVYKEIPFSTGAKFPDANEIAAAAKPVRPIATRRSGEKIMPYPAIVFHKSDNPSYPDYFGLVFLTKEADARTVEEKARYAWQKKGGVL